MMLILLIGLGWKSALIAGVALTIHAAMRNRPAAERAALLQAALLALLALPVFALLLPALDLDWLPGRAVAAVTAMPMPAPTAMGGAPAMTAHAVAWGDLAIAFYGAGVAMILLRFAIGVWTLRQWTRHARPAIDSCWREAVVREAATLPRPVRLLVSSRAQTPLSWGVFPAFILIGPATHDSPERAAAVIAHEMAHIRRFDWLGLVIARLTTALFWFNPLSWLIARELARDAELAADAEALRHVPRHDYADALIAVAGGRFAHREAVGMAFTHSALARRITATLDGGAGGRTRPVVQAMLLVVALGAAGPIAAARIVPAAARSPAPPAPVPEAPLSPSPGLVAVQGTAAGSETANASPQQPFGRHITATPSSERRGVVTGQPGTFAPDPRPSPEVSVTNAPAPTATRITSPSDGQVMVNPQGASIIDRRTGAHVIFGPGGITLGTAPGSSPPTDTARGHDKPTG
jgi:beta-lactamase regulating signal transducer with metallopeptidase domain